MTTAHTPTAVTIPARELRKGDKIGMGTIAAIEVTSKHVLIDFECRVGAHGTAFPLDLEVTVLSRTEVEVDVVAELTALADQWQRHSDVARKCADPSNLFDLNAIRSDVIEICVIQLRELLGRLA